MAKKQEKKADEQEDEEDEDQEVDKEEEKEKGSNELIQKATDAAERLEKATERLEGLMEKQVRLKIEQTLGGTAEAGTKEKSKEEKEIADARKLLEGSGFEDQLFPEKKQE